MVNKAPYPASLLGESWRLILHADQTGALIWNQIIHGYAATNSPMTEKKLTDPAEIIRRIKESEGERVSWKIQALHATFFIFAGNRHQLLNAIGSFEAPTNLPKLWTVENRPVLRTFQEEIARLLHNFLASAATLIDHTRILVRDLYEGKPFYQEYQSKSEEVFDKSELTGLIKGLRDWMLHKGLVPVVATLSNAGPDNALISSVVLDLAKLRSWDKWDVRAKAYLAPLHSNPELDEIVSSYADLVESFYTWLEKRMHEIHSSAFQELDDLQNQLRVVQAARAASE